jgi:hypothetical protein
MVAASRPACLYYNTLGGGSFVLPFMEGNYHAAQYVQLLRAGERGAQLTQSHTQMRAEKGFKPICGIAAKHLSVFYECALGPSHLLMGNLI